ncbi:MAG: hypothetical protein WC916_05475 [Candidatus Woesearchaeota archaeon]
MKYYLDSSGKIIEKPENLEEQLQVNAPELASKLEGLKNWKGNMVDYRDFLYVIPDFLNDTPSDNEVDLLGGRTPIWEQYISAINEQIGLKNVVGFLNLLKTGRSDIIGDTALVLHSNRPFYDSLLTEGERIGAAEGWIGTIESYDVTNLENSKFMSLDGKIYQRIALSNARKLTSQELSEFVLARIAYAWHHHNTEGLDACIATLRKSKLGTEKIHIYDKYPNVDHLIFHHVLKEDEKAVAHISYEDAEHIDLTPYYGQKQIPESQFTLVKRLESAIHERTCFIGDDPRKVVEIYQDLKPMVNECIRREFKYKKKLESVSFFIGKLVKNYITPEQREKAAKAPLGDAIKWYKKYIDEQGLEITNHTFVGVQAWGPHIEGAMLPVREILLDIIGDMLTKYGYTPQLMNITYGWDDTGHCGNRNKLIANTDMHFRLASSELYAAELVRYLRLDNK